MKVSLVHSHTNIVEIIILNTCSLLGAMNNEAKTLSRIIFYANKNSYRLNVVCTAAHMDSNISQLFIDFDYTYKLHSTSSPIGTSANCGFTQSVRN